MFEIGNIRVGGVPENPPVMIGTIFYHRHRIVEDPKRGVFDRGKAESLIKMKEELSDKTGIPALVDVAGETVEALTKYVDFVANITDNPFLIDVLSREIMEGIVKYVSEVGLNSRVIVNSLTPRSRDYEFKLLKEHGVKGAVALLYVSQVADFKARLRALEELLPKLNNAGITVPLVDTFVIDPPSLIASIRAIVEIKSKLGFPSGCGAHNAASQLRRTYKVKFGVEGYKAVEVSYNIIPLVFGADFVLYGPIESCETVIPAAYSIYVSYKSMLRYVKIRKQEDFTLTI